MKHIFFNGFVIAAALILSACGVTSRSQGAPDSYYYEDVAPQALPTMRGPEESFAAEAPAPTGNGDMGGGGDANASSVERLVIQNADVAIVVSDVEARMQDIQEMAQEMGGFVVGSNLYQGYTRDYTPVPEATVTIRVPSEKLEQALDLIKKDVVEVQNESRSGQDVTAEYVDLKSRLKNLEAAEAQLNEIMQDATETEDVVNIFNQLVYYREQIEIVKGQMEYYEDAAALSAISIRIIAEETIQPIQIGKWEPQGVARDAIQDLIYFYQDFVEFLIRFVIYTLPVWITVGIPLYLIFIAGRWVFRKLRGNKKKVEPKVEEEKKSKK